MVVYDDNSVLGRWCQGFSDIHCYIVILTLAWDTYDTVFFFIWHCFKDNQLVTAIHKWNKQKITTLSHTYKCSCFSLFWEASDFWSLVARGDEQFDERLESPIHEENQCHLDFCIFLTESAGIWSYGMQSHNGLYVKLHLGFHLLIQPLE